jgi:hypothetical protein
MPMQARFTFSPAPILRVPFAACGDAWVNAAGKAEAAVKSAECFKKSLLESCIFFMGQQ